MGVWQAVRPVERNGIFCTNPKQLHVATQRSLTLGRPCLDRHDCRVRLFKLFKVPPHDRTTATTVDMFEKRPRTEERDEIPRPIDPADPSLFIDTGDTKLTHHAARAMQLRQHFIAVSRTLTTPEKAATYFNAIGSAADNITHALAHFVHLMGAVYTWQYAEVWQREKGTRVALESYFLIVDPLEIEFARVRRSLQRIGRHTKRSTFTLPWEDVVGAAFQVGHCVRKVIRTPGVFGTPDTRTLLMERAGVVRACAFPVRTGGTVTHTVALFDVYSDGFAAIEQSAFADFAIAHLSRGFDAKKKKDTELDTQDQAS